MEILSYTLKRQRKWYCWNFEPSLGIAWEGDKDKLRCQADSIYAEDPSLIFEKEQVVKKASLKAKTKKSYWQIVPIALASHFTI